MNLEESIERLTEIRDRFEKNIKILEENNAILKNTNFYEVLGERRADYEAIDTVLKALDERYNKGYQDGFKQAKYEVDMDKLQEEMTVSELKRIIKEYTKSHDLCIATDCSFFEIVEDAVNIAKEIKEGK